MAYNWSDNPLSEDTKINISHIYEIRNNIDKERNIRNMENFLWTDIDLSENMKIKTIHIQELRDNLELVERIHRCISHNIAIDNSLYISFDEYHDTDAYTTLEASVYDLEYKTVYNRDYKSVESVVDTNIFIEAKIDHDASILFTQNSNNDDVDKDNFNISKNKTICATECTGDFLKDLVRVNMTNHVSVQALYYIDDKISDNNMHDNNEHDSFNLNVT